MNCDFECDECKTGFADFDTYNNHKCGANEGSSIKRKELPDNVVTSNTPESVGFTKEGNKCKCNKCFKLYANEGTFKRHVCKPPASVPTANAKDAEVSKSLKESEEKLSQIVITEVKEEIPPKEEQQPSTKVEEKPTKAEKPDKKFSCDACKKSWVTEKGYNGHKCTPPLSEEEKEAKKEQAKAERKAKSEQAKAEKANAEPVIHTCDECAKQFKTKQGLKNHKCKPQKDGTKCPVCTKVYKNEKRFENHKCVPKYSRQCEECKKDFKTEKGFIDHVCEMLECKICNKIFQKKLGYDRHIASGKCANVK